MGLTRAIARLPPLRAPTPTLSGAIRPANRGGGHVHHHPLTVRGAAGAPGRIGGPRALRARPPTRAAAPAPSAAASAARHPDPAALAAADAAAAALRTPHAGYHFDGTPRRFFEGWYWKVDLPGGAPGDAFALIYVIEDEGAAASPAARALAGGGARPAVAAQVMGPGDGYICHYSSDVGAAWADAASMSLGAAFVPAPGAAGGPPRAPLRDAAAFDAAVSLGFEATPTWHQGRLTPQDRGAAGVLPSTVASAAWAFSITPTAGWGPPPPARQRATAGWLAALPVFEPHWQVCMARGLATGWFEWDGRRVDFTDAPAYAEKNWGGGFPSRWWWVQCDAWDGGVDAALTAVGARRRLPTPPGLPQQWEDVGMVGLHVDGQFFELVPWVGDVAWDVDPWGRWSARAETDTHAVEVEATCTADGTPLRAPTADRGLAILCRDSFAGKLRVRLYEKGGGGGGGGGRHLVRELTSDRAAVEVGGGPWARPWVAAARMREPFRSLVKAGIDPAKWPARFRPPGL